MRHHLDVLATFNGVMDINLDIKQTLSLSEASFGKTYLTFSSVLLRR